MTSDTRKARIEKIKALLAKTVENGCTEAEMLAALDLARKLMDEWEIGENDLSFGGEEVHANSQRKSDHNDIRRFLCMAVGRFCDCQTAVAGLNHVIYYGLPSDTLFAHWLLDTLEQYVNRALRDYLTSTWVPGAPSVRRRETAAFVDGCCGRIVQRLKELHAQRNPGNGRGIVLAKNALIDEFLKRAGIKFQKHRRRAGMVDAEAQRAGIRAGNAARFDRPINGGGQTQRLK